MSKYQPPDALPDDDRHRNSACNAVGNMPTPERDITADPQHQRPEHGTRPRNPPDQNRSRRRPPTLTDTCHLGGTPPARRSPVLNITPLRDAEYLISSVALGIDEYYLGVGEAPGVWQGRWAAELGLAGVVEADELRALVEGVHPATGVDLLEGHRKRETFAFDATYSCPKSVSLLWAFATPETAAVVSRAHTEAVATALAFLEDKAAFARRQEGGVRRRVGTHGFAVATFVHRTSRGVTPNSTPTA
jgi:hypothetical protein